VAVIFSASTAHRLLSESPLHAYNALLTPDLPTAEMDLGTVAHQVILEHSTAGVVIIDAPDWRTKVAKEARDAARAEGKTPILAHKWAVVEQMVAAVERQLEAFTPVPFAWESGLGEHSLYVTLDGVECRATPDWLTLDNKRIWDLKTTGVSANPAIFSRTLWDKGYHLQAALYRRVVLVLTDVLPEFEFVVVETEPPYALSIVGFDPEALAFADTQLDHALAIWKRCRATNQWPGYPTRVAYAEVPAYLVSQWAERSYYDGV
jgi:hypothetical protein